MTFAPASCPQAALPAATSSSQVSTVTEIPSPSIEPTVSSSPDLQTSTITVFSKASTISGSADSATISASGSSTPTPTASVIAGTKQLGAALSIPMVPIIAVAISALLLTLGLVGFVFWQCKVRNRRKRSSRAALGGLIPFRVTSNPDKTSS
jgi:hypothetical protein